MVVLFVSLTKLNELKANGLEKDIPGFDIEKHDDTSWKVFYVVAPDGLCYWFGERQTEKEAADEVEGRHLMLCDVSG